ncbi:MAG: starch-binding protein, partial [Oscillospiraceae bacterium]|nr:starch-binding protein [Oscillospiraceae bacterium]
MTETAKSRAGVGQFWKRFISLVLAFAMMLTFVPGPLGVTTAHAEGTPEPLALDSGTTYIVAGVEGLCGSKWNASDSANQMTLNSATGLYEKVFDGIAAGTYEFKVTDGTWTNSWGDGGNNYSVTVDADNSDVTITFNADTKAVGVKVTAPDAPAPDPDPAPAETIDVTIHAKSSAWGALYAYAWDASGNWLLGEWPGTAMDADADHEGWYVYEAKNMPADGWSLIIDGGGDNSKTADLTVEAGKTELWVEAAAGAGSVAYTAPEGWYSKTLYLNTGGSGLWNQANAWFAAYFSDSAAGKSEWVKLTASATVGVYQVKTPGDYDYPTVTFKRMDASATSMPEGNVWNTTNDLTIPTDGKDCYTITGWGGGDGDWGTYTPATYYVAGDKALCGVEWATNDPANKMTYNRATGLHEKVFENVPVGYPTPHYLKVTDGT